MKKTIQAYKLKWNDKALVFSSFSGGILFVFSLLLSNEATEFATEKAATNVPDLIISNVPVFNVSFIVNEVAMFYALFVILIAILNPKTVPFALKSAALFILIRSAFITFTHLGPFPDHSYLNQSAFLNPLNVGSDFFFSGHTGLPYLMALVFWNKKIIRNISLIASVIFGISVLLGHLHYSIDVFAAFFITYSIFVLAQRFFPKDYKIIRE